jgi:hypothetical protein
MKNMKLSLVFSILMAFLGRLDALQTDSSIEEEKTLQSYDMDYVYSLTGLSEPNRKRLINYYARLPEQTRIEAHKLQTDLLRQSRDKYDNARQQEFTYAMLLLALAKMKSLESGQATKKALTDEEAGKITELRIQRVLTAKNKGRESKQKHLIEIRFYEEIKNLKEKGLSWREIAEYIKKYHKKKISHGYLQQCYHQIKREKQIRGEE